MCPSLCPRQSPLFSVKKLFSGCRSCLTLCRGANHLTTQTSTSVSHKKNRRHTTSNEHVSVANISAGNRFEDTLAGTNSANYIIKIYRPHWSQRYLPIREKYVEPVFVWRYHSLACCSQLFVVHTSYVSTSLPTGVRSADTVLQTVAKWQKGAIFQRRNISQGNSYLTKTVLLTLIANTPVK